MVATNSNNIGRLVKEVRSKLGLSQEKLAAELGVTFSTVNRWENGKVKPSPLALRQIEKLVIELGADGKSLREEFFLDPSKAMTKRVRTHLYAASNGHFARSRTIRFPRKQLP